MILGKIKYMCKELKILEQFCRTTLAKIEFQKSFERTIYPGSALEEENELIEEIANDLDKLTGIKTS